MQPDSLIPHRRIGSDHEQRDQSNYCEITRLSRAAPLVKRPETDRVL